jgi:yecA family protein
MKRKARRKIRYGHVEPIVLLPPDLRTIGELPFTGEEFEGLDAWLAETGWPTERMDIAMLEGYLVALLVWPIELSPGAWLPPIWGVRGWKIAAKIASPEAYGRFIALVMGFLQELDRRLNASQRLVTFALAQDAPYKSGRYFAGSAWATGFMTALEQNSAGLRSRSVAARSAVECIARYASLRLTETSALPVVGTTISAAVATLLAERPSRGPLGPLGISEPALALQGTLSTGGERIC